MEGLLRFTPRGGNPLFDALEPVITGLGMILVELSVFHHKGGVQIRAVVSGPNPMGVEGCSRVHHALLPRLELAFPGQDLSVEVSSPGIDRVIKDGSEFACYIGRGVRCFRTDISDWSGGILVAADTTQVTIKNRDGEMKLDYEIIAKAKLDYSQEVENSWQRI
ncbi:ribosome assembly cofactor RimP [Treponema sp. TIM-1]|uniref:ribosome assembly cofactor RimP n=1 Tax=Treponema sp. TIM-1 TaxID=2898417 RepID=UPI00398156FA